VVAEGEEEEEGSLLFLLSALFASSLSLTSPVPLSFFFRAADVEEAGARNLFQFLHLSL